MLTAAPGTMETPTLPARSKDEVAVVVPVYMGKAVLRKLCGRLVAALEPITPHFSIVLVDDRSPDDAWPLIQELGREDRRIRGVQLSRNFGQHYALSAGIDRIFSDRVADGFRQMREQMRLFPASLSFMGFAVGTLELPHHPREDGKSSYTFAKPARLAAEAILAHSQTPLKLATYFGLAMAVVSILAGLSIAIRALVWGIPVTGWASLIVAVFVVGGVQIFITGIVGIYVGKTFEEAKKRPLYFVRDTVNLDPDEGRP